MLDAIVASNGANYVDKDRSGKFVNATNRPEFLEALQFALLLNNEGVLMPRPEDSNWDWYRPMFHDGKVAMMVSQQYVAQELRDMTDDWGFVLFPKGPRSKPYRYRSDENMMVIPSTFNIYRDPRAADETLTMIRNPAYGSMKYYVFIPGLERGDIAWNVWFEGADSAQLVESVSQSWNALINEAMGNRASPVSPRLLPYKTRFMLAGF
jgi:ABC-type glycerol-3-phosphate transport system substrate-binding protein